MSRFGTANGGNSRQNPEQAAILAKKQLTEKKQREAALHKRQQEEVTIFTLQMSNVLFQIPLASICGLPVQAVLAPLVLLFVWVHRKVSSLCIMRGEDAGRRCLPSILQYMSH